MAAAAAETGEGGLFLEWKFGGEAGRVALPADGSEVVLGRGAPAAVQDVRASRRQVAVAVGRDGAVRVRALGLNPALVEPDTFLVRQAPAPAVLPVGGTLCLLCDRTYPFTLRAAPKPKPTARWQWRADDGWCDYAAPVAARLEAARRSGTARVDIDSERFVDVPALLQRRKDDPSKRREVRRVLLSPAAPPPAAAPAVVPHKSSASTTSKALDGCVVHFVDADDFRAESALCAQAEALGAQLVAAVKGVTHFVVAPATAAASTRVQALLRSLAEAGTGVPVVAPEWLRECVRTQTVCPTAPYAVAAPPPAKAARRTIDSLFGAPAAPAAAAATAGHKRVVWYWRADDGSWTPYSDALSRKIESVYAHPESDETRVVIDKLRYVDLVMMKQRHHINDDLERDIKREVL